MKSRFALTLAVAVAMAPLGIASAADPKGKGSPASEIDHSGRKQSGVASYYGKGLDNKKTANGDKMDPGKMTAASKTLPLGTHAKVTNTDNGKSANVTINDRGPFVKGRILDVTPKAAEKLGIISDGVSPVEVKPLDVPQTDGKVKHPAE